MTSSVTTNQTATAFKNPFIGLKAFSKAERSFFFGRSKEVKEVLRKYKSTRLLAIVGPAGSGKASMIKAGILPELESGYEGQAGTNWGIAMFSPGLNPIGNMANALAKRNVLTPDIKAEPNSNKIEEVLRRSSMGLVNCIKERSKILKGKNIVLVINQFEELFSLMNDDTKKNEARDFIKLLLRGIKDKEQPIYVLLSIQSDMMSEITQFRGLPEVINQGQYLMPRMTKQEIREVILRPLRKVGLPMNESLRGTILDEVEQTDDQLPVLQHSLMRIVEKWQIAKVVANENNEELDSIEREHYGSIGDYSAGLITDFEEKLELYRNDLSFHEGLSAYELEQHLLQEHRNRDDVKEYVSRVINTYKFQQEREFYSGLKPMEKAMGVHAEEVFAEVPFEYRKVCEWIFKAITDGSKGIESVQTRPVEISTLAAIAEVDTDVIKDIIRIFIKDGRNFVQANQRDLRGSTTITLTHGCLVRRWNRLRSWVEEETESAKTYIRLATDAAIHETMPEKQGLWRDNQLSFGETWFNETKPNAIWAMRYHPGYVGAISFLEKSIAKRDAELEKAAEAESEEKRRRRMILYIVSSAAIICLCLATWAYFESQKAAESAADALQKEELANLSAKEAEAEKRKASRSAREAALQAEIAKKASEKAAEEARKAKIALAKARVEEQKAIAAGKRAQEESLKAKEAEQLALVKEKEAIEAAKEAAIAAKEAETQKAIAQKLKLQSLAEAIAIKSKRIENKPEVQGQIAKKAVEIFQKSDTENPIAESEIFNPAIYEGVYYGIKAIKESKGDRAFNEFIANDKHRGTIHAIAKVDNVFYTAGSDGKILQWDIIKSNTVDKPKVSVSTIGKRSETVLTMAVFGRTLVTGGKDRRLAIFTLGSSNPPIEVNPHGDRYIWQVAFAGLKKDKIVSSGQDKKVYLTDVTVAKNGGKSTLLLNSANDIKSLDVHINGQNVVLGATNGRLSLMDISVPNKETRFKVLDAEITAVKYSPNGRYIVVGDAVGKVHVFDTDLTLIGVFESHNLGITDVEFNGNNGFITTSPDRTAKYWTLSKLQEKNYEPFTFNDHSDWCTAANFTGNQAVIGCKDGSLKFWALDIGTLSNELCGLLDKKRIQQKDWNRYIGEDAELEATVGRATCR